jgi:hypothetical protein
MIKYYNGALGSFEYDDEMYEVITKDFDKLHFKDSYIGPISLPNGILNCNGMFKNCHIKEGCFLKNFDTRQVTYMHSMFEDCKIPKDFTFDNVNFNTHYVIDMRYMFNHCIFSDNFSLGKKFYTVNCKNMNGMFAFCKMNENFTLGNLFNTKNCKYMKGVFYNCDFPKNFSFPDNFCINVKPGRDPLNYIGVNHKEYQYENNKIVKVARLLEDINKNKPDKENER